MDTSDPTLAFESIDWDRFDFIDLGSSTGGSIAFCTKRFGAERGLGIDLDPNKVARARDAGVEAVRADATDLRLYKRVRFVSMLDFLEHLPSPQVVEAILAQAAEAATDFLFIRHPSFEGEGLIEMLGVRQYWWHWSGHTCHIRISDYCEMFERLGLMQYCIRFHGLVQTMEHESLVPLSAPVNTHAYDPERHEPKPIVDLPYPIWRMQSIFVALRPFEPDEWRSLVTRV